MQETKWDDRKAQTCFFSKLKIHFQRFATYSKQLIVDTIEDMMNIDSIKHG